MPLEMEINSIVRCIRLNNKYPYLLKLAVYLYCNGWNKSDLDTLRMYHIPKYALIDLQNYFRDIENKLYDVKEILPLTHSFLGVVE